MRATGRRPGFARSMVVLTAVLAASLSSFSGVAAADDRPDSDRKKGGRDANPAEAAAESPEGEAKEAAPPPADATDVAVPPASVPTGATTTERLKARSGPSTDGPAVRTLDEGTAVDITCQTKGGEVEGSSTWYQLADGTFVSAAFISTPGGANGAPECGASQTAGNTGEVLASIDEAPPADAPGQRAAEAGAPAAAADSVLFVVDTSQSMFGAKLDQAKVALRQGIAYLTTAQAAGLRNFPAPGDCDAGQLLVPIATGNRPALQSAVDGLAARGYTPTAAALRAAVADLPTTGTRTIVLISDGAANCGGDPCVAAKDLVASGVKFTVQAVGFNVSGAAPAQLQCIADSTGGRYVEATDGAGLAEAIKGAIPGGGVVSVSPSTGLPGTRFGFVYTCPKGASPLLSITDSSGANVKRGVDVGLPVSGNGRKYTQSVTARIGSYVGKVKCGGVGLGSATFSVTGAPYVALGDSYSSGEGASLFTPSSNRRKNMCHRAPTGWASDVATAAGLEFDLAACSGAIISDFYRSNPVHAGEIPQLDHIDPERTKLVTYSVGGNDVGFADVLTDCISGARAGGRSDCRSRSEKSLTDAFKRLRTGQSSGCSKLPGISRTAFDTKKERVSTQVCGKVSSLHALYQDTMARMAPGGQLLVVGYPELFGREDKACTVGILNSTGSITYEVSEGDVAWLNSSALKLNNVIGDEVRAARQWAKTNRPDVKISFVGVNSDFNGHRLCDQGSPWINGLIFEFPNRTIFGAKPTQRSFHPNDLGQDAQGRAVIAKLS